MALSIVFVEVRWEGGVWSATRIPGDVRASYDDLKDDRFRRLLDERDANYHAVLSPDEATAIARPHWESIANLWRGSVANGEADKHLACWEQVRQRSRLVIANLYQWDTGLA